MTRLRNHALRLGALLTLGSLAAATPAFGNGSTVDFTGWCPPNGYNMQGDCTNHQPPFDHDLDGDGRNDSWGNPISISKPGGGNFQTTDACGNSLCLVCIPDPRGPGKGGDYFSPRFKRPGEVAGTEVGKCVYDCGRNTWKICFQDQNGDCVPDKFTMSCWESRNGGDDWPFNGCVTTFCADLTKRKIVPVRTKRREAAPAPGALATWEIQDAVCVDLDTDLSTVMVGGEPLAINSYADSTAANPAKQETYDVALAGVDVDLSADAEAFGMGDQMTIGGSLHNPDTATHTFQVIFFGIHAQIVDGPVQLVVGPGETRTFFVTVRAMEEGSGGVVAFAHSDRATNEDGAIAVKLFTVNCADGGVTNDVGDLTPVLSVGGATGSIDIARRTPLTVSLAAPPAGPPSGSYGLWLWSGPGFHPAPLVVSGQTLGCTANPTPFQRGVDPQPFLCLRGGLPHAVCVGVRERRGAPSSTPWTLTRRNGVNALVRLTLQGLVEDQGASNPFGVSVTNAVVVRVH